MQPNIMRKMNIKQVVCIGSAVLLLHGNCLSQPLADTLDEQVAVFTVQAEGQLAIARVLTHATSCPAILWNGRYEQTMTTRVGPTTVALRGDSAQSGSKPAVFDVLTCESNWPVGITSARVGRHTVPSPHTKIHRVVIIADTGCRMKGSEDAFQPCNDVSLWPFAQIAKSAAALKPDMVVHIGDIHYRESPCPADRAGCANSPWGYGLDAWQADLFEPARPLLAAAPWVFVRGNHESCARAGQGWFRFVDAQPWTPQRSCNEVVNDDAADFSDPYAVTLDANTQFIVFDSSKSSGKPYLSTDPAFAKYVDEMQVVERLTKIKPNNIFMSHHPLHAVVPSKNDHDSFKSAGSKGLQSAFSTKYPERLLPQGVSVAMHGHVHLFESISFAGPQPASLVLGNSGSANEGHVPTSLPTGTELYPGAVVQDYAARAEYGFATLDRVSGKPAGRWLLTEYTEMGRPVMRCIITDGKSRCKNIDQK
jgi:hypothetical protein